MKISNWMIALAIFSGLSVGMGTFFYNFASEYGINDVQNITVLNKLGNLTNTVNETSIRIKQQQGLIETIFTTAGLLWGVFTQMLEMPFTFIGVADDLTNILAPTPIPVWFIGLITFIIMAAIIYGIAAILANRENL